MGFKKKVKKQEKNKSRIKQFFSNYLADDEQKLTRKDWIIMGLLTVVYIIISFYNLGSLESPKTYYQFDNVGESVGVNIPGISQEVSKVRYYTGPEVGEFSVLISADGEAYKEVANFEGTYVFAWEEVVIGENAKYIAEEASKLGMNDEKIKYFSNKEEVIPELKKIIDSQDILLFKASNGMRFFDLVEKLKKEERD